MPSVTALWEAFRSDPSAEDLFSPESHIVFLPTGAGAATDKQIQEFYKNGGYTHPRKLHVQEKVIHRTIGESSAVDEVEATVKFISGGGGWLLPGIEPYHIEDLTITFPLVRARRFFFFPLFIFSRLRPFAPSQVQSHYCARAYEQYMLHQADKTCNRLVQHASEQTKEP